MGDPQVHVLVILLGRDREVSIGSTILKIRDKLENGFLIPTEVILIDNGSLDETPLIASMSGARVFKYPSRVDRNRIIKKGVSVGVDKNKDVTIILDLMGENSAEDVISLVKAALNKETEFASGYVLPESGIDTIGCLALDKVNLNLLAKKEDNIQEFLLNMARSRSMDSTMFTEQIEVFSKKKKQKKRKFRPGRWFKNFRRQHPLKFYGILGIITLISSLVFGFMSVDHFYKHQNVNYLYAVITVVLVMTSGFLLVAGMMLNALNMMVERVRSNKKWKKATEEGCE